MEPVNELEDARPKDVERPAPRPRRFERGAADLSNRYGIVVVWAALVVVFSILKPDTFFTWDNFQTIFDTQSALLILTLGMVVPLCAGEFDLSIAGVLTVSLVLIGYLNAVHGMPVGFAVLIALGAGLVVGLVNAFIVIVIGVESIVVTLGGGTLLLGVSSAINNVTTSGISTSLVSAVRSDFLGLQLGFFYALALTAVLWYVFSYTPLGRYVLFVGHGRDVARLSGLPVDWIRGGALVVSSLLSALAGVVLAGTLGASDPTVGASYLLPAFAAAFLGAAVINPGRFNPWGTFIAVYFLATGITGLETLGLSGWIEQVFYGGSLIIAVALAKILGRRRRPVG